MRLKILVALMATTLPLIVHGRDAVADVAQVTAQANAGNAKAQFELGMRFAKGDGVAKDEPKAVMWLLKSAQQGYSNAEFILGVMYANGEGVKKSDAEAAKWFRKVAEKGDEYGQLNLGTMYAEGIGMPVNNKEAYKWFSLSAAQGNKAAQGEKAKLEKKMTAAEIAEALRLAAEWKAKK